MDALLIAVGIGFLIGLVLGLLGGGGSILTVPALVYLIGQPPQVAVTASLVIVGTNSVVGAWIHRKQGTLNWRVAIIFGGTGMLVAYFSAGISKLFPPTTLLILFSVLMLFIAVLMLTRSNPVQGNQEIPMRWWVVLGAGAVIGLLTGILGVGGGFLIVPALVMLIGLPMQQAVGTSLIIIAMNSLAGILGHLGESNLDWRILSIFIVTGLMGTYAGTHLSKQVNSRQLQRLFALFVMVLAVFLLADNVHKLL